MLPFLIPILLFDDRRVLQYLVRGHEGLREYGLFALRHVKYALRPGARALLVHPSQKSADGKPVRYQ
jgi:hypothetical protein